MPIPTQLEHKPVEHILVAPTSETLDSSFVSESIHTAISNYILPAHKQILISSKPQPFT